MNLFNIFLALKYFLDLQVMKDIFFIIISFRERDSRKKISHKNFAVIQIQCASALQIQLIQLLGKFTTFYNNVHFM